MTDKLADALIQMLDDGGFIKDYDENDRPIFVDTATITTGGGYCGQAAIMGIEALTEHEATNAATPDDVREAVSLLHTAQTALTMYGQSDLAFDLNAVHTTLRNTQGVPIDTMAELLYLRYCHECGVTGARWELNDSKDVWREKAILNQHARGG